MQDSTAAPPPPQDLPRDAQSILELAARSMFDLFANASEGMLLVDREARVVWINDQYKRFLPALGFEREEDFVGHPVSQVVPNTQMHQVMETGKPILIDLLTNRAGTFVVSRIPLRDAAGQVIGALGIVLFDHAETTLQPLIEKFSLLQRDLDDARRELTTQRLRQSGQRQSKYSFASFIGMSAAAVDVKRHARRAAQSSSPVLLLGETGTGKELLAHAIHGASNRAAGPFISVNIAAVPDTLLEAEFFGFVPGAFTGADRKGRDGKFRLAHGGTLFLDEIGDMPFDLQTRLLRVLSDGHFYRVGGHSAVKTNVRVIAATHQNLEQRVKEGVFREDLFHRLNVIRLRLPALRERREDIPALTRHFLQQSARQLGVEPKRISDAALAWLGQFAFPGNVRQLENMCHWLTVMAPAQLIEPKDLPPEVAVSESATAPLPMLSAAVAAAEPTAMAPATPDLVALPTLAATPERGWEQGLEVEARALLATDRTDVWDTLTARFESCLIQSALAATRGRRIDAAQKLGIGRNTITRKIQELGLE